MANKPTYDELRWAVDKLVESHEGAPYSLSDLYVDEVWEKLERIIYWKTSEEEEYQEDVPGDYRLWLK